MMRKLVPLLFVAVAVGCSSDDGDSPELQALQRAANETMSAGTARVTFTVGGSIPTGGDVTGEGAFDLGADQGQLQINLPEVAGRPLGRMDAVTDKLNVYLKLPPELTALVPALGTTPWVKIDAAAAAEEELGIDLRSLTQGAGDPSDAIAFLRGADDASVVGTETLRGVAVTHYEATIDLDKAVDEAPASARKATEQAAELLGDQDLPADVWVDQEGHMRKMSYQVDPSEMELPEGAGTMPQTDQPITYTFELYDFGAPVNVEIPPADQTTDITQLLDQLGGS